MDQYGQTATAPTSHIPTSQPLPTNAPQPHELNTNTHGRTVSTRFDHFY